MVEPATYTAKAPMITAMMLKAMTNTVWAWVNSSPLLFLAR